MAGDFICLEKQNHGDLTVNIFLTNHLSSTTPVPPSDGGTHKEELSVRYSSTSCSLAEGGNWRSCGTWLQAEQLSCQPEKEDSFMYHVRQNRKVKFIESVLLCV